MPLKIIRSEIINLHVDAIVNPTDECYSGSGSIDLEVQYKCGKRLKNLLKELPRLNESEAVITDAYNMNCKKIIHVHGPIWNNGNDNEIVKLEKTYANALDLVVENNLESVAFPLISTGKFGFPKELAVDIATNTIAKYLFNNDLTVYLVVYDKESFGITKNLFDDIQEYIDENYINEASLKRNIRDRKVYRLSNASKRVSNDLDLSFCAAALNFDKIKLEDTFTIKLLNLIDQKKLKDSDVYKKANIDRKLFSKIRSNLNYNPSKKTAIALGIALELTYDELQDLLSRASYTLSHSNLFDVVIEGCINKGIYDIFQINNILFEYDLPLLD